MRFNGTMEFTDMTSTAAAAQPLKTAFFAVAAVLLALTSACAPTVEDSGPPTWVGGLERDLADVAREMRAAGRRAEEERRRERMLANLEPEWRRFADYANSLEAPQLVLESNPDLLVEKLTDFAFTAVVYGATAYGAYQLCAVAGAFVFGPAGHYTGLACVALTWPTAKQLTHELHAQLFDRPIHEDARVIGAIVGTVAGTLIALPVIAPTVRAASKHGLGLLGRGGGYSAYAAKVRRLTEGTFAANRSTLDPNNLRGMNHHLDHLIPVKCGWRWGLPAWLVAEAFNLRIIPAAANLSRGALGC